MQSHTALHAPLSSEAEDGLSPKLRAKLSLPLDSQRLTEEHSQEPDSLILRNRDSVTCAPLSFLSRI